MIADPHHFDTDFFHPPTWNTILILTEDMGEAKKSLFPVTGPKAVFVKTK
jgi:hypothetical protein